jgi:hypothetical protein
MSNNTSNQTAFIEAEQYSSIILENLYDELLPDAFARDVSDFGSGTTLNIKTLGEVTLQDVSEETPINSSPIDTDTVTLAITDHVGTGWHVTDELRQDGAQVDQLAAGQARAVSRAIGENYETTLLAAANSASKALTDAAATGHTINGARHRFYAGESGTDKVFQLEDFAYMNFAFGKANAPDQGRIAIVDPIVELTLNTLTNIVGVSNNPMFEGIVTEGFAKGHRFIKNVYGWDIYVANRNAIATGDEANVTMRDGGAVVGAAGDVSNLFMCVTDPLTAPMMKAWRQQPKVEGWRDPEIRADRFQESARWGVGAQRVDTLGIILSSATLY